MYPLNAQPVLDAALHRLTQLESQDRPGEFVLNKDDLPNPMETVAAANCLYMMGVLPGHEPIRKSWVDTLKGFQATETGCFTSGDLPPLRVSAACISALSLFNCTPDHPPREWLEFSDPSNLNNFFSELDWCRNPIESARSTSALFTVLVLSGEAGADWEHSFFNWIDEEVDEHTGLLRRHCLAPMELEGQWTLLPYLCAHIYPMTTCHYARHPCPLPWRLIDTCLEVMEFHRDLFFKRKSHRHLPWVLLLTRSLRHSAHRFEEGRQALERFLPAYLDYLQDLIRTERYTDLRAIQWDLATLAELQTALPGQLSTRRPLRQILEQHPFL